MHDRDAGLGFGAFGLVAVAIAGYFLAAAFYNDHEATCTVTGKDRGAASDGGSSYRIYTDDCGVLANEDQFLRGKFDSADTWGQITDGETYRFRVVGFRFPLFSQFPNILAVGVPDSAPGHAQMGPAR